MKPWVRLAGRGRTDAIAAESALRQQRADDVKHAGHLNYLAAPKPGKLSYYCGYDVAHPSKSFGNKRQQAARKRRITLAKIGP